MIDIKEKHISHETYKVDTAIDNGWDNSDNWRDFNYGVNSEISNA